jgi:site-specific recombinase XerD
MTQAVGYVLLTGEDGGQLSPGAIERGMRKARSEVKGLPAGFRHHDLRHYFASLLIASGADVDTVLAAYLTEQRRNSATAEP